MIPLSRHVDASKNASHGPYVASKRAYGGPYIASKKAVCVCKQFLRGG
jgi:hypothetical protein